MSYVPYRFTLPEEFKEELRTWVPDLGYNGLGEITMLRTYSRKLASGRQETWHDIVIRNIEGVMSIRKSHYFKNKLKWDDEKHMVLAMQMSIAMFELKWLPPGRSLWAMGTDYIYDRGSAALNNCGYVSVDVLSEAAAWTTDMLMCGVGIGFDTYSLQQSRFYVPLGPSDGNPSMVYQIPDSREGWAESVRILIESYEKPNMLSVEFDYSKIRGAGEPIRGFGGTSSGPEPLMKLHQRIREYLWQAAVMQRPVSRTITDVMNAIGACVVAGNVRRSAELAIGEITDEDFLHLKDYSKHPEREEIGWMSNNSVIIRSDEDLEHLPLVAERILKNGEPGIINLHNIQNFGRMHEYEKDGATGFNPCAEMPLKSYELCNLVEVFPTRCEDKKDIMDAISYATFFASSTSLLLTHSSRTNAVIEENRRIGVSMSGIADYLGKYGEAQLKEVMQSGYPLVRSINKKLAKEANIAPAVRVTTVKPSGTISLLAGVSPGMHWPTFKYAIRRIRISADSLLVDSLKEAGYPWEVDYYSDNTLVFEFPIAQTASEPASEVSLTRQAMMLRKYQEWWSDNAVSCTLYFDPETEDDRVLTVLRETVPFVKSLSMLPHTNAGAYKQMPYEGITEEEYEKRCASLSTLNLLDFINAGASDGMDSRFCQNDSCEISFTTSS